MKITYPKHAGHRVVAIVVGHVVHLLAEVLREKINSLVVDKTQRFMRVSLSNVFSRTELSA